ncbi:MAG: hypothetical protein Kow0088_03850 [Anaerolineales bacterium]
MKSNQNMDLMRFSFYSKPNKIRRDTLPYFKRSSLWLWSVVGLILSSFLLSGCASATMMSNWPGAVLEDDIAYVAYQAHVYAIQAKNGSEIWRFPQETDNKISFYAPPALSPEGDQLVIGGFNHVLYSLNPENGTEQWRFEESKYPYIAAALITADSIYAPTNGHVLYALDRQGKKRWEFKTGGPIWATPTYNPECDCLYVASLDHSIYALKTSDGTLLWKSERLEGAIASSPVLSQEGVLYFGTFGNRIHAYDVENRSDQWTVSTTQWVWASPLLTEDQVVFTDLAGNVISLDPQNGNERWRFSTAAAITATPALQNNLIFVGNEAGQLFALDLQGNPVWQQPQQFDGKILTTVLPAAENVLVPLVAKEQLIIAVNQDGGQAWSYQPVK